MKVVCQEIICKPEARHYLSQEPQTVCEIFSYEPENAHLNPLGNLYIVTELRSVKDCGYLANLLASIIKREYYSDPLIGAFKCFQQAIRKANIHLSEMAKDEKPEWLAKLHFFCAALPADNILFTQAGQIKAYLARHEHFSFLGGAKPARHWPGKSIRIFGSIISGSVEAGDKLIIATPETEKTVSSADLKEVLTEEETLGRIADRLNEMLNRQENRPALAILMMKTEKESDSPAAIKKKMTTEPIDLKEILK